ncbi:hypothetical protein FB451DRAFT_1413176 [Mycena latifolia]|nr:hypothetical protein FB451DRAFT_1413176 [Mycena latifolia]
MSPTSILHDIVFSTSFRLYNARVLLVTSAFIGGFIAPLMVEFIVTLTNGLPDDAEISIIAFISSLWIVGHQTFNVFSARYIYAAFDIMLTLAETGVLGINLRKIFVQEHLGPVGNAIPSLQLATLTLSALFRAWTMWASTEKLYKERFDFFGGCPSHQQPNNPFRFLLGRSLWKPLVRDESEIIEVIRGVTLIFLSLGLPVFAVYTIIFVPALQSQVEIRSVIPSPNSYEARSIIIGVVLPSGATMDAAAVNVTGNSRFISGFDQPCPVSRVPHTPVVTFNAECDSWDTLNAVTVSLDFSEFPNDSSTIVHV